MARSASRPPSPRWRRRPSACRRRRRGAPSRRSDRGSGCGAWQRTLDGWSRVDRARIGRGMTHRIPSRAMPQAAVDGISLFYERRGAGEPVLLIQGMSGTHLSWGERFMAALRDDLDVVAYDHRGVGESTPQADPFTIARLADD